MPNVIGFDPQAQRHEEPQYARDGVVSAARVGKPGVGGTIEDNGVGISNIGDISLRGASDRLRNIFDTVRNQASVRDHNVAATAATAITTREGVAWRGAGDAPIVAIGANGRVIVLNNFHTADGEVVTNSLTPGGRGMGDQAEAGSATWGQLEKQLGTSKIRIAVMSDGVSRSHSEAQFAADIQDLIRSNRIKFDDPNWSGRLLDASSNGSSYSHYKPDDRVVVSAQRPTTSEDHAMLGAFDGVGSGGEASARVAHQAVQASQSQFGASALVPLSRQAESSGQVFTDAQIRSQQIGTVQGREVVMVNVGSRKEAIDRQEALAKAGVESGRAQMPGSSDYYITVSVDDWNRKVIGIHPDSAAASGTSSRQATTSGRVFTDAEMRSQVVENIGGREVVMVNVGSREAALDRQAALADAGVTTSGRAKIPGKPDYYVTVPVDDWNTKVIGVHPNSAAAAAEAGRSPGGGMSGGGGWLRRAFHGTVVAATVGAVIAAGTAKYNGANAAEVLKEGAEGAAESLAPGSTNILAGNKEQGGKDAAVGALTIGASTLAAGAATAAGAGAVVAGGVGIAAGAVVAIPAALAVDGAIVLGEKFETLQQKIGDERAIAARDATPSANAAGALLGNLKVIAGQPGYAELHGLQQSAQVMRGEYRDARSGNIQALRDQSGHFAELLAKELRAEGPAGDAVRQAMKDQLTRYGMNAEQYAQYLTNGTGRAGEPEPVVASTATTGNPEAVAAHMGASGTRADDASATASKLVPQMANSPPRGTALRMASVTPASDSTPTPAPAAQSQQVVAIPKRTVPSNNSFS